MITQKSRKDARLVLESLENNVRKIKEILKKYKQDILKKEEEFFSEQVGKYFKSKSGKRFFKILSYESAPFSFTCGLFDIYYFDVKNRVEHKIKTTTCYTVFGNDFELAEITKEEYEKNKLTPSGFRKAIEKSGLIGEEIK